MEELDYLKELFKSLVGEDVEFNMTYVDKNGKKEEFSLNTKPNSYKKDMSIDKPDCLRYEDLKKTIELKDKYINQLVARLDQDNKEKVNQQKKIEQSKLEYIELCKHFSESMLNLVASFDVLVHQLGFQDEDFYMKFNNTLSNNC